MNKKGTAYGSQISFTTLSNGSVEPIPNPDVVYVSLKGNDSNDGSSWEKAKRRLSEGLKVATQGNQIWVSAGVFKENLEIQDGISVYGGFEGNEEKIDQRNLSNKTSVNAIITEACTKETYIDGFLVENRENQSFPFGKGCVVLRDYTIMQNCIFRKNKGPDLRYCQNVTPAILSCQITENSMGINPHCSPILSNFLVVSFLHFSEAALGATQILQSIPVYVASLIHRIFRTTSLPVPYFFARS